MNEIQPNRRTVVKERIASGYLPEGFRSIRIYLPPGYQEVLSYPVVYGQDGEDLFNFGRVATQAQHLILEEDWEPFVVVGVDVDKKARTAEYAPDGDRHEAYTRFFAEELLPFVESRYAVRADPAERLLVGDSLGAAVNLSLAIRRPDLFQRVLSLSGAYYEASLQQLRQTGDLSGLRAWLVVGLQETAFVTDRGTYDFVDLNRQAKQLLEAKGAKLEYAEKDGEHKWGFWQRELPAGLGAFLGPDARL